MAGIEDRREQFVMDAANGLRIRRKDAEVLKDEPLKKVIPKRGRFSAFRRFEAEQTYR